MILVLTQICPEPPVRAALSSILHQPFSSLGPGKEPESVCLQPRGRKVGFSSAGSRRTRTLGQQWTEEAEELLLNNSEKGEFHLSAARRPETHLQINPGMKGWRFWNEPGPVQDRARIQKNICQVT